MDIQPLSIVDSVQITPRVFSDHRGWFTETYNAHALEAAGFKEQFVQDNMSFSKDRHTLRGMHFQRPPFAQGKLVRVISGAIRDVFVDLRPTSPSYKTKVDITLTAETGAQVFVPAGCLHGFLTLEADTLVSYKVTARYSPEHDGSVAWNDPDLDIDWGVEAPVLSEKDEKAPFLRDIAPII